MHIAGGTLNLTGKAATVNSQTINGLTIRQGASEITTTQNERHHTYFNVGGNIPYVRKHNRLYAADIGCD